jgi:hypothetical protein
MGSLTHLVKWRQVGRLAYLVKCTEGGKAVSYGERGKVEVGNVDSIPEGDEADLPGERVKKTDSSDERAEGTSEANFAGRTHLVKESKLGRLVHLRIGCGKTDSPGKKAEDGGGW